MTRNMRLHRSNETRMLRRDGRTRCKYCGTPIEFFDRYDGTRIPLTPEFPVKRIPARLRWHVNRGIAYPGKDGVSVYCRIPHPAVCPAADHPDLPEELAAVVRLLERRMHQAVRDGDFIPYEELSTELEVEHPDPEPAEQVRHIVAYFGILRIGPCAIEDLQCIAEDRKTGRRCDNGVHNVDQGTWELTEINPDQATGRQGQLILDTTQGRVWAWQLTDYHAARRWWAQRCEEHFRSPQPDAVSNEFIPFHPVRHDAFILTERPTGYEPEQADEALIVHEGPGRRTKCARCTNSTVGAAPEGWLCWQCDRDERRRARVHRRRAASHTTEESRATPHHAAWMPGETSRNPSGNPPPRRR
ncbi:DUF6083 domain-containing protein [Streptomyces sp. NPDC056061]|uniref:DUF6083 domain-containing protein n=1 Tax=Streptomyces sp. NPDC056061 TaxID=3345700 RepID=UPI0035E02C93